MSEYSDRVTLNLKENSLSLNLSFQSNKSFYDSLDEHTKRDILFLINSGYNKKSIIKIFINIHFIHQKKYLINVKYVDLKKKNI